MIQQLSSTWIIAMSRTINTISRKINTTPRMINMTPRMINWPWVVILRQTVQIIDLLIDKQWTQKRIELRDTPV